MGKTSLRTMRLRARVSDLDPVCASPYRPAACEKPHLEAGHTTAPDHMSLQVKIMLAFTGASTHDLEVKRQATWGMSAKWRSCYRASIEKQTTGKYHGID